MPKQNLEVIGLEPKGQHTYTLANGAALKLDITSADIESMGKLVGRTISSGQWGLNETGNPETRIY